MTSEFSRFSRAILLIQTVSLLTVCLSHWDLDFSFLDISSALRCRLFTDIILHLCILWWESFYKAGKKHQHEKWHYLTHCSHQILNRHLVWWTADSFSSKETFCWDRWFPCASAWLSDLEWWGRTITTLLTPVQVARGAEQTFHWHNMELKV